MCQTNLKNFRGMTLCILLAALVFLFTASCRAVNSSAPIPSASVSSSLQLFVLPDAGSKPVLDFLNSAQKSIRMTMYLLSDRDVIDALKSARGRGVDVRVLLEMQPTSGAAGNQQTTKDLQTAKVTVKAGNPGFRLTHEKSIVVDDRAALVTTANMTRVSFTTNREYVMIDSNLEDVAEIANVFEADWKRTTPVLVNANLVWSPVNARTRLLSFIDGAVQALEIEAEEVQDAQVEAAITNAVKRGVQVRLVVSPAQDTNAPDQQGIERLKKANIQVRVVKAPYIHARMMIADNKRAFIGSENLSGLSLDSNRELGILISDPRIIQTLSSTFAGDWNIGK